jgi:hypothetical protein
MDLGLGAVPDLQQAVVSQGRHSAILSGAPENAIYCYIVLLQG